MSRAEEQQQSRGGRNEQCKVPLSALIAGSVSVAAPFAALAAQGEEAVLEEVVVTAQRREKSAQSVAIAITALNGDELNDKAVTRLDDRQFASPSLRCE
jgi:iron complex outermembrane recepter protein